MQASLELTAQITAAGLVTCFKLHSSNHFEEFEVRSEAICLKLSFSTSRLLPGPFLGKNLGETIGKAIKHGLAEAWAANAGRLNRKPILNNR